jgi:hypothetical protein
MARRLRRVRRDAGAQEWLAREEAKARVQLEMRQLRMRMLEELNDDAPSVGLSDRPAAAASAAVPSGSGGAGPASVGRGRVGTGSATPGGYSVTSSVSGYHGGGGFATPGGFSTGGSGGGGWSGPASPRTLSPDQDAASNAARIAAAIAAARQSGSNSPVPSFSAESAARSGGGAGGVGYIGAPRPPGAAVRTTLLFPHGRSAASTPARRSRPLPPPPHADGRPPLPPIAPSASAAGQQPGLLVPVPGPQPAPGWG